MADNVHHTATMRKLNGEIVKHLLWGVFVTLVFLVLAWNAWHAAWHVRTKYDMVMFEKKMAEQSVRDFCTGTLMDNTHSCTKMRKAANVDPWDEAIDRTSKHMRKHWAVFKHLPGLPDFTIHKYLFARTLDTWSSFWLPLGVLAVVLYAVYVRARVWRPIHNQMYNPYITGDQAAILTQLITGGRFDDDKNSLRRRLTGSPIVSEV